MFRSQRRTGRHICRFGYGLSYPWPFGSVGGGGGSAWCQCIVQEGEFFIFGHGTGFDAFDTITDGFGVARWGMS